MIKLLFGLTLIYLLVLVIDVPLIRGLYDPIFPSEWPYYYVNTWSKIWVPILAFFLYTLIFYIGYRNLKIFKNGHKIIFWILFILAAFMLHLSYVHFSRFGITVLFQRIVNPGMNGYFSSAIRIDTNNYLTHFSDVIENLDQHARDHPPGSILFIKGTIYIFEKLDITNNIVKLIPAPDGDVEKYWNGLSNAERVSGVFLAFFYHLVGALTVMSVFFISKLYFDNKKALLIAFLWGLVPSISFFALKFDSFYFLIFAITAYFFLSAAHKKNNYYLAGLFASFCIFFSYSIIPGLAVLGIYFLYSGMNNIRTLLEDSTKICIGFFTPILILLLCGYNSFSAFLPILTNQAPRSYWQWVVYNPFDFFQHFGISLSVLFFIVLLRVKEVKKGNSLKNLAVIFVLFFIVLVISGISRAEVGRIWMPLMLFPLLSLGLYKKLSLQFIIALGVLLFLQNITMTEFWVPIW